MSAPPSRQVTSSVTVSPADNGVIIRLDLHVVSYLLVQSPIVDQDEAAVVASRIRSYPSKQRAREVITH